MAALLLEPRAAAAERPTLVDVTRRDKEWFAELYESTCDSVYRCAMMLVRNAHLAEDVAAEVYLRAWRSRDRFAGSGTPIAWVLSITRNCAMDELRNRREQYDLDAVANYEAAPVLGEQLSEGDVNAIHDAIQQLTSEQQIVVFLRFFEGLPHDQVAERLGRRPNAIRAIQFRALSRMRKILEAARAS